jgi:hypothetical protein
MSASFAIVFRLIGALVAALNWVFWRKLSRQLQTAFPRRARFIRAAMLGLFPLVFYPSVGMLIGGWSGMRALRNVVPEWLSMSAMGAQFAAWMCLAVIGVAALSRLVARGVRRFRGRSAPRSIIAKSPLALDQPSLDASLRPASGVNDDRRRFVAAAPLALPVIAAAVSAAGVAASRQTPVVRRVRLPVRRDMTNLHGVTIAQVSDVHVGSYMDAERLDEIRDAINSLRADFHVITGDLLDNHVDQLELAARFVRGLQPRRGQRLLCMGNHEYIAARTADVRTIVGGLEEAGGQVLIDEARALAIGGDRIWMAGIDYPPSPRLGNTARETADSLQHVVGQMRDDGAPRVVLSHHPRTFVEGREAPLDLMLSGHTHGGQIKLGRIGDYALTPVLLADHYHNGLYEHRGRRLYVNAGAGGWLPVRLNCPPEITLVELVPA